MDLSAFDTTLADEGVDMPILNPRNGEPLVNTDGTALTLRLLGTDAKKYRANERALLNRRLTAKEPVTAEQMDEDNMSRYVALTAGWSGIGIDGVDLPYSDSNARKLYARLPWLREQVDRFCGDRKHFLRDLPTA